MKSPETATPMSGLASGSRVAPHLSPSSELGYQGHIWSLREGGTAGGWPGYYGLPHCAWAHVGWWQEMAGFYFITRMTSVFQGHLRPNSQQPKECRRCLNAHNTEGILDCHPGDLHWLLDLGFLGHGDTDPARKDTSPVYKVPMLLPVEDYLCEPQNLLRQG